MRARDPEIRLEAEEIANRTLRACERVILEEDSIPIDPPFKIKPRYDWSPGRTAHRGGWYPKYKGPHVSMAMWQAVNGSGYLQEYASFAKDPDIGNFHGTDWRDKLRCLVTHEAAHAAQFTIVVTRTQLSERYRKTHGEGFREIYRVLRRRLINKDRLAA